MHNLSINKQREPNDSKDESSDVPSEIEQEGIEARIGQDQVQTLTRQFDPKKEFGLTRPTLALRVASETQVDKTSGLGGMIRRVQEWRNRKEQANTKRMEISSVLIKGEKGKGKNEGAAGITRQVQSEIGDYADTPDADEVESHVKLASDHLFLSEDFFIEAQMLTGKDKDKKLVAKKASAQQLHEGLEAVNIAFVGDMVPWRFEGQGLTPTLVSGEITPTSFLSGRKGKPETDHLMNTYAIVVKGQERAIIRSGKIDTEQRANDFFALLKEVCQQLREETGNDKLQLRVCSQQLNSFESESQIIKNQRLQINRLNIRMAEEGMGEIVHLSLPSNRFYDFTLAIKKIPTVGAFLERMVFKGEKQSKEQNLEGIGAYLKWLNESLVTQKWPNEDLEEIKANVSEINRLYLLIPTAKEKKSLLDKIALQQLRVKRLELMQLKENMKKKGRSFEDEITDAKNHLAELKERYHAQDLIKKRRGELKAQLTERYSALQEMERELNVRYINAKDLGENESTDLRDPEIDKIQTDLRKVIVMKEFLGAQLGLGPPVSRGMELRLLQTLNEELGITSGINCKSGLDRTGFLHSATVAAAKKRNQFGAERAFTLSHEWDALTQEVNTAVANARPGEDPIEVLLSNKDLSEERKRKLCDVIEYRKTVLADLIRMGIPITYASTGLVGIKWNEGFQENLIPLNFLPPFVEVKGHPNNHILQLVNYDKEGNVVGLTTAGRQLLTKLSSFRGS